MKRFSLWAPIAFSVAAFAFLYRSVIAKLVYDWTYDGNFSHGFLIVPIAVYLVWERRKKLAVTPITPSVIGLVLLVGSLATLAAGILGAELFLSRVSMIGVIGSVVLFTTGWRFLRVLMFPLAFLLLMIPIPAIVFNQISLPLQLLASKAAEYTLQMVHIPVLREGNVIVLANTSLEVAEACSGIRSLISLVTLAIVYGYFTDARVWARSVLTLAAVPVAVVSNAARVAGTGVAAHYYGPQAAEGFFHTFSGWMLFLVAFVMLFGIQKLLGVGTPATGPGGGMRVAEV
ncbi:MAG TPA: exosortase A [Vicinamibacterales bacterium]|nr:exosortase A [Vicinamibacterales bacterium]